MRCRGDRSCHRSHILRGHFQTWNWLCWPLSNTGSKETPSLVTTMYGRIVRPGWNNETMTSSDLVRPSFPSVCRIAEWLLAAGLSVFMAIRFSSSWATSTLVAAVNSSIKMRPACVIVLFMAEKLYTRLTSYSEIFITLFNKSDNNKWKKFVSGDQLSSNNRKIKQKSE